MKAAEYDEGPQAYERFRAAMQGIVNVPHTVIQQRIEQQARLRFRELPDHNP